MKKFSAILMGFGTILALLFGSLAVSAPAQAAAGSRVIYESCAGDACGKPVRITTTTGLTFTMAQGRQTTNVFRVCPYSIGQRIGITGPNGGYKLHPYGACFAPGGAATYRLEHLG